MRSVRRYPLLAGCVAAAVLAVMGGLGLPGSPLWKAQRAREETTAQGLEVSRPELGLLLAALPLALLCGAGAAVAARKRDGRILSAGDLREALGFAPIAILPVRSEVSDEVYGEFVLRLAAGIEGTYRRDGARTFLIAPVSVSTDIGALGSALLRTFRGMGVDVAMPTAAEILGRPERDGLVPDSEAAGEGYVSANLDRMKAAHKLILIEADAALPSAQTEYLALWMDATILVVECGVTSRAELRAASRVLQQLRVRDVSAVLEEAQQRFAEADFRQSIEAAEVRRRAARWHDRDSGAIVRPVRSKERSGDQEQQTPAEVRTSPVEAGRSEAAEDAPATAEPPEAMTEPSDERWVEEQPMQEEMPVRPAATPSRAGQEGPGEPVETSKPRKSWIGLLFGRDEDASSRIFPQEQTQSAGSLIARVEEISRVRRAAKPEVVEPSRARFEPMQTIDPIPSAEPFRLLEMKMQPWLPAESELEAGRQEKAGEAAAWQEEPEELDEVPGRDIPGVPEDMRVPQGNEPGGDRSVDAARLGGRGWVREKSMTEVAPGLVGGAETVFPPEGESYEAPDGELAGVSRATSDGMHSVESVRVSENRSEPTSAEESPRTVSAPEDTQLSEEGLELLAPEEPWMQAPGLPGAEAVQAQAAVQRPPRPKTFRELLTLQRAGEGAAGGSIAQSEVEREAKPEVQQYFEEPGATVAEALKEPSDDGAPIRREAFGADAADGGLAGVGRDRAEALAANAILPRPNTEGLDLRTGRWDPIPPLRTLAQRGSSGSNLRKRETPATPTIRGSSDPNNKRWLSAVEQEMRALAPLDPPQWEGEVELEAAEPAVLDEPALSRQWGLLSKFQQARLATRPAEDPRPDKPRDTAAATTGRR